MAGARVGSCSVGRCDLEVGGVGRALTTTRAGIVGQVFRPLFEHGDSGEAWAAVLRGVRVAPGDGGHGQGFGKAVNVEVRKFLENHLFGKKNALKDGAVKAGPR